MSDSPESNVVVAEPNWNAPMRTIGLPETGLRPEDVLKAQFPAVEYFMKGFFFFVIAVAVGLLASQVLLVFLGWFVSLGSGPSGQLGAKLAKEGIGAIIQDSKAAKVFLCIVLAPLFIHNSLKPWVQPHMPISLFFRRTSNWLVALTVGNVLGVSVLLWSTLSMQGRMMAVMGIDSEIALLSSFNLALVLGALTATLTALLITLAMDSWLRKKHALEASTAYQGKDGTSDDSGEVQTASPAGKFDVWMPLSFSNILDSKEGSLPLDRTMIVKIEQSKPNVLFWSKRIFHVSLVYVGLMWFADFVGGFVVERTGAAFLGDLLVVDSEVFSLLVCLVGVRAYQVLLPGDELSIAGLHSKRCNMITALLFVGSVIVAPSLLSLFIGMFSIGSNGPLNGVAEFLAFVIIGESIGAYLCFAFSVALVVVPMFLLFDKGMRKLHAKEFKMLSMPFA